MLNTNQCETLVSGPAPGTKDSASGSPVAVGQNHRFSIQPYATAATVE